MKILEETLLELNTKNLAESIKTIQGQIDYHMNYKMDVKGISLLPIRDSLDKKYTDKMLRENGYILTLGQFEEDCKKFITLAKTDDPILHNSQLKRLHRSYKVILNNYIVGNIENRALVAEMKKHLSEIIQSNYVHGDKNNEKMPKKLEKIICDKIDEQILVLDQRWHANKLDDNINKEFTELLSKQLLEGWREDTLPEDIKKHLMNEKSMINSTSALINCFREGKLPKEIDAEITTGVMANLRADINGGILNEFTPLGALINDMFNRSMPKTDQHIFSNLITNWRKGQTSPDVSKDLEEYIKTVINEKYQHLDSCLAQQFEQLAVNAFLDKFQQGRVEKLEDKTKTAMEKYTIEITKGNFLCSTSSDYNMTKSREKMYSDAMEQLHDEWIGNKLSPDINDYLKKTVFAFLTKLDDDIKK